VATYKDAVVGAARRVTCRGLARAGLVAGAVLVTAGSAILVKELAPMQPLAALDVVQLYPEAGRIMSVAGGSGGIEGAAPVLLGVPEASLDAPMTDEAEVVYDAAVPELAQDPRVRWFNGRPVRPARTMWMTVTGYSPDAASCAPFDDGLTATLHSVHANAMKMVAADTRLLPFGSLLTVPGYDDGHIVPVLDRGGAIKGHKLDLMFPTHSAARQWGRQRVQVTVWEYADGLPADNPRDFR
jgi:3D (Asp-Asp-Asp) domain-containing protein